MVCKIVWLYRRQDIIVLCSAIGFRNWSRPIASTPLKLRKRDLLWRNLGCVRLDA